LELSLTRACAGSEVRERLDAALPDGIDVIDVMQAPPSLGALPLEASLWEVVLPGVSPDDAARAAGEFLACDALEVERRTSKGNRRVDARAAVITVEIDRCAASGGDAGNAILRMVVRHVIPAVRPDDILAALRRLAALAPSSPPLVTRLAQGALSAEAVGAATAVVGLTVPEPREPGPQPYGRGTPGGQQLEITRTDGAALAAATRQDVACDQLPRGAEGPLRPSAPGSLTGDSPDARQRATRHRVQR
jgi:hypothetical protein